MITTDIPNRESLEAHLKYYCTLMDQTVDYDKLRTIRHSIDLCLDALEVLDYAEYSAMRNSVARYEV